MDTQNKLALVQELLERIEKMEFTNIKPELSIFIDEGEVILSKIFDMKSKHVDKFNSISFSPMVYSMYSTEDEDYHNNSQAFYSGKNSMISMLKGAIKELDLELLETPSAVQKISPNRNEKSKVFIVHGHDDGLKNEVARFVENLGFKAVILHEQANEGKTIIEKIGSHSEVGFAIVLYTPCDEGKSLASTSLKPRARQNVVFEHGYFIAKLGRSNVVALHKGEELELPNDISGVVYVKYESGAWKYDIAKEMRSAGYSVDMNKI